MTDADGDNLDQADSKIATWTSPESVCSYLPQQTSSLTYRACGTMSAAHYETLLERGWRRHGVYFFRPACPVCRQCRSLRVPPAEFRPSKSQRRCWRRHTDVQVEIERADVSRQHLELFNRYHADMHQRRGWPYRQTEAQEYAESFLVGDFDFAYELRFWRDQQLSGISLIDVTPRYTSSVYFYHDPAWRPTGPGVYSMLVELSISAQLKREYHYLGYWIADCRSMAYKSQYRPHEILRDHVADDQLPSWDRVSGDDVNSRLYGKQSD